MSAAAVADTSGRASGSNRVFLGEDGLIHNEYVGLQTYDSVKAVERLTLPFIAGVKAGGKPALILADLRALDGQTAGSRRASKEALETRAYDRVAIFGGSRFLMTLSQFIVTASGLGDRVRCFRSEKDAVAWLRGAHGR